MIVAKNGSADFVSRLSIKGKCAMKYVFKFLSLCCLAFPVFGREVEGLHWTSKCPAQMVVGGTYRFSAYYVDKYGDKHDVWFVLGEKPGDAKVQGPSDNHTWTVINKGSGQCTCHWESYAIDKSFTIPVVDSVLSLDALSIDGDATVYRNTTNQYDAVAIDHREPKAREVTGGSETWSIVASSNCFISSEGVLSVQNVTEEEDVVISVTYEYGDKCLTAQKTVHVIPFAGICALPKISEARKYENGFKSIVTVSIDDPDATLFVATGKTKNSTTAFSHYVASFEVTNKLWVAAYGVKEGFKNSYTAYYFINPSDFPVVITDYDDSMEVDWEDIPSATLYWINENWRPQYEQDPKNQAQTTAFSKWIYDKSSSSWCSDKSMRNLFYIIAEGSNNKRVGELLFHHGWSPTQLSCTNVSASWCGQTTNVNLRAVEGWTASVEPAYATNWLHVIKGSAQELGVVFEDNNEEDIREAQIRVTVPVDTETSIVEVREDKLITVSQAKYPRAHAPEFSSVNLNVDYVRLTWKQLERSDFPRYNGTGTITNYIYRAEQDGGERELIGATTANEFYDRAAIPGVIYKYWVVSALNGETSQAAICSSFRYPDDPVDASTLLYPQSGGQQKVEYVLTNRWRITTDQPWVHFSESAGDGATSIGVAVEGGADRVARLVLSFLAEGQWVEKCIEVCQEWAGAMELEIRGREVLCPGLSSPYYCVGRDAMGGEYVVGGNLSVANGSSVAEVISNAYLLISDVSKPVQIALDAQYVLSNRIITATKIIWVNPESDLSDAVDSDLYFTSEENGHGWTVTTDDSRSDFVSVKNGLPNSFCGTDLVTECGPGVLSFWCKADSLMNGDKYGQSVWLYVGGSPVTNISYRNASDWVKFEVLLKQRTQCRWSYFKSSVDTSANGTLFIDDVTCTPIQLGIDILGLDAISGRASYECVATNHDGVAWTLGMENCKWSIVEGLQYAILSANGNQCFVMPRTVNVDRDIRLQLDFTVGNQTFSTYKTIRIVAMNIVEAENMEVPSGISLQEVLPDSVSWFGQSQKTYQDKAAFMSGLIEPGEESVLEMSVNGGGILSFYWSVVGRGYDYCEFYIDGVRRLISSAHDWRQQTYELDPATAPHCLKWRYVKRDSAYSVDDGAWVSGLAFEQIGIESLQISIGESDTYYVCNTAQVSCVAHYGNGATKIVAPNWSIVAGADLATVDASGSVAFGDQAGEITVRATLNYCDQIVTADKQIVINPIVLSSLGISGRDKVVTGSTDIPYVCKAIYHGRSAELIQPKWSVKTESGTAAAVIDDSGNLAIESGVGELTVKASYTFGGTTHECSKTVEVIAGTLSAALNCDLDFEVSDDDAWTVQSSISHDGTLAIRGEKRDSASELKTTLSGPGHLSFWWKTDTYSQNYGLTLLVDNKVVSRIGGSSAWTKVECDIPWRDVEVRFVFANGTSYYSPGYSCTCWIDQFCWTPEAAPTFENIELVMPEYIYRNSEVPIFCDANYSDGSKRRVAMSLALGNGTGDGVVLYRKNDTWMLHIGDDSASVYLNAQYEEGDVSASASKSFFVNTSFAEAMQSSIASYAVSSVTNMIIAGEEIVVQGGTAQLVARVLLKDGSSVVAPATWSATAVTQGSQIAEDGMFTAGTVCGENTVCAVCAIGSKTLTANHSINVVRCLQSLSIQGDSQFPAGAHRAYTCIATYADGSKETVSPTWAVNATLAHFIDGGVLVADVNKTGSTTIRATFSDHGVTKSITKSITISKPSDVKLVVVGPEECNFGDSPQFSAQLIFGEDQAVVDVSSLIASWSVIEGGQFDSISSGGKLTAQACGMVKISAQQVSFSTRYTAEHTLIVMKNSTKGETYAKLIVSGKDSVEAGTPCSYSCYAIRENGMPNIVIPIWSIIGGGTNVSVDVNGNVETLVSASDCGSVRVNADYGEMTGYKTVKITPSQTAYSISEALAADLFFDVGGATNWYGYLLSNGKDVVARSQWVPFKTNSWIKTTVTGPGTLVYRWMSSSSSTYSYLDFAIDGIVKKTISRSTSWNAQTNTISAGVHEVMWRYTNKYSATKNSDYFMLDDVRWKRDPVLIDLNVIMPMTVSCGKEQVFSCTGGMSDGSSIDFKEDELSVRPLNDLILVDETSHTISAKKQVGASGVIFTAVCDGSEFVKTQTVFVVSELTSVNVKGPSEVTLEDGGTFECIAEYSDGSAIKMSAASWEIVSGAGTIDNGCFVPSKSGVAVLRCYLPVNGMSMSAVFQVIVTDELPDLGENPTTQKIALALDGMNDDKVLANITDGDQYARFRTWAMSAKDKSGNVAGMQGVRNSQHAWVSFALDSDKLLVQLPTDEDLTVEKFEPASEAGKFDFTVSVDGVNVGSDAQKENLKQVFGLEGATSLNPDDFSSGNVDLTFGTPADGKVKFTAGPKDTNASTFFMKVKVNP